MQIFPACIACDFFMTHQFQYKRTTFYTNTPHSDTYRNGNDGDMTYSYVIHTTFSTNTPHSLRTHHILWIHKGSN